MQTFVASIFVFGLLILVHELGHFFAARLTGIRVLELAIGFGPKLFGWTRNKTDYSLRAVPLGGFCRMLGEDHEESNEPDSFPRKPVLHRAFVLLAGAAMNLVLAVAIFFVIFFFMTGVPDMSTSEIGQVLENTPAEEAGLQEGDRITAVNSTAISRWEGVLESISPRAREEIALTVQRGGESLTLQVTPALDEETGTGKIGIVPVVRKYMFVDSLQGSFERFGMVIASIFQVLTGRAPLDVAGPVGIVSVIGEVAQTGFINLLLLTALISISLGIMNLLPIPALDGGRLLFLAVEAVRGRPIDPEKEGMIHFIGFAFLIMLILFITYQDLIRLNIFPN